MAAGKTTIGKRLARELGVPFVDTDELIRKRFGPIPEVFAREGDAGFRRHEFEVVREALEREPAVIALGGGAVTHEPTRRLIEERATRIFLDVDEAALVTRLKRSRTVRPVLGADIDPLRVRALLEERLPLYRTADLTVRGAGRSKAAIVQEIAERVRAT